MADEQSSTPAAAEGASANAPAADGAAPPANKKQKMLLIGSIALAVVGVIVAVGVFFVFGNNPPETEQGAAKAAEIPAMAVFDVPTITTNLLTDTATSGPRFLKITLAVELENPADSANVGTLLPRLQDDWGNFLRQLRPTDLQGSAAMQTLREALLRRAVQTLQPIPVKAVLVREMLVQ